MSVLPGPIQAQLEAAELLQQAAVAPQPEIPPASPAPQPSPTPEAPVAPAEPVAQPAPDGDAAYWRQRFETMQGKYNAEVPRLHSQVREQGDQLSQLTGRLDQLTRQAVPPTEQTQPLITANDEERFGADLIDAMRRVVRDETKAYSRRFENLEGVARTVSAKADRVGTVEQHLAATREERFYEVLVGAVPDWEAVNVDPRWLKWLAELDPMAGRTRQQLLDEAMAALDARRVVAAFGAFKATLPAPAPSSRAQAATELARQVAPSRSSTAATPPAPEQMFTGAQYTYWFDPRRKYDTEPAALQANLAALEKAQGEGRIDWSK